MLFDWLSLSGRLVSTLPTTLWHIQAYGEGANDPDLDGIDFTIYWLLIFSPVIPPLLLWYLISRRASRVAKWLLAFFVAYEALAALSNWLASTFAGAPLFLATAIGMACLDGASLAMLFRREAREWFDQRRLFGKTDPATFD